METAKQDEIIVYTPELQKSDLLPSDTVDSPPTEDDIVFEYGDKEKFSLSRKIGQFTFIFSIERVTETVVSNLGGEVYEVSFSTKEGGFSFTKNGLKDGSAIIDTILSMIKVINNDESIIKELLLDPIDDERVLGAHHTKAPKTEDESKEVRLIMFERIIRELIPEWEIININNNEIAKSIRVKVKDS